MDAHFQLVMGTAQGFFCVTALDKLADFAADSRHHVQQHGVRWKATGGKKFDDTKEIGAIEDWKNQCCSQAGLSGESTACERALLIEIRQPCRASFSPNTAGQAFAWSEAQAPAFFHERFESGSGGAQVC